MYIMCYHLFPRLGVLMSGVSLQQHRKEVIQKLNEASNFFKHADEDPNELLEFNWEATPFFLVDAVGIYQDLAKEITPIMLVMRIWFFAWKPYLLMDPGIKAAAMDQAKKMNPEDRQSFLVFESEFAALMYGGES